MLTLDDICTLSYKEASDSNPTDDNLRDLIRELYAYWVDDTVELRDTMWWAFDRFDITRDDDLTYQDYEAGWYNRIWQYKNLLKLSTDAGILDNDTEMIDMTTSIIRVINSAKTMCFGAFLTYHNMEGSRENRIPPQVATDEETFEEHNTSNLTSFQALLIYILQHMFVKKYRKCGDACYEQAISRDGYPTLAYKFCCTIEDEVMLSVQKETSFPMWKHFTNPRDNPKMVIDHLTKSHQAEFPTLDVGKGNLYSFDNGIYDIRQDLFFVYGDDWAAYAKEMECARNAPEPYTYPTTYSVSVNYFPIEFRNPPVPSTALDDPRDIKVPVFDKLFDMQNFDQDTRDWACIMIGRLFFPVNDMDRWQRALALIGSGGTGKTSFAEWIKHVVGRLYALISSNMEDKFGIGPLCDDRFRVAMCTEMGDCLLYTSPSPRDGLLARMPSSA